MNEIEEKLKEAKYQAIKGDVERKRILAHKGDFLAMGGTLEQAERLKEELDWFAEIFDETVNEEHEIVKEKFLSFLKQKEQEEATEVLVKYVLEKNHIYTLKDDNKLEMWIYREGIYVPNGVSEIRELLRKILGIYYSRTWANIVLNKIEADTYIHAEDFFNTNYKNLIPVKNGILNVFNGTLEEFTPKKIFFSKLSVNYTLGATCTKIDHFLSEVLANENDKEVFYELVGFSLLKEYRWEKSFMLIGNGRNGKGKTIELIKRLLGAENCCSIPLSSLSPESFRISELLHKLTNLAGDVGNKDLKDTSMFKMLTGRDLVGGQRKFLSDVHFENYAKMVFACNELPMVYDISKGFWDRWILLEFPYTFVSKEEYEKSEDKKFLKIRNTSIIDDITSEEELSGLLNQALLGLARLLKNDNFSYTLGSAEVKERWIRTANSFMAFAMDYLVEDYQGSIIKKELRMGYKNYCKKHKVRYASDFQIKNIMTSTFGSTETRKTVGDGINRGYEYIWEGVTWKPGMTTVFP